jgi:hypothetical protein
MIVPVLAKKSIRSFDQGLRPSILQARATTEAGPEFESPAAHSKSLLKTISCGDEIEIIK